MKTVLINHTSPFSRPIEVVICSTFFTKLRGLMFQKKISPFSGIVLLEERDSVINSAIHMLFMSFDICVVWVNKKGRVVDRQLARRWHVLYKPAKPACLTLELHTSHMKDFKIGDKVSYETS